MKEYELDPDFRKLPPKDSEGNFVFHCRRCQKEIKDPTKAIYVNIDWTTWTVTENGTEPVGKDCWNKIVKKPKN